MGRPLSLLALLVAAAGVACAKQLYLISELSFGHDGKVNHDKGFPSIQHFSTQGNPRFPDILSDRIMLTPPAPSNQRGAVWAENALLSTTWGIDVDFRASGPERGSGNLCIWLAQTGAHDVGSNSIYTVGRWEGLALVVDQHGGAGGMIRGFLNDGRTDYRTAHSVDSLSFGHCVYPYRNRGIPSKLKLHQDERGFRVEVDGHVCFESDKVHIPAGYNLGVTAASSDNPDSFEVYKVVTTSDNLHAGSAAGWHEEHHQADDHHDDHHHSGTAHADEHQQPVVDGHFYTGRSGQATTPRHADPAQEADDPFDTMIPDSSASAITSTAAQFADLHDRLQQLNHHLTNIFRTVGHFNVVGESRHAELSELVSRAQGDCRGIEHRVESLDVRLGAIERDLKSLRQDVLSGIRHSEGQLRDHVSYTHEHLKEHVEEHAAPGHGRIIIIIVASQILLALGYLGYKRRKSTPKKYL